MMVIKHKQQAGKERRELARNDDDDESMTFSQSFTLHTYNIYYALFD
jgi:hypothetical protein